MHQYTVAILSPPRPATARPRHGPLCRRCSVQSLLPITTSNAPKWWRETVRDPAMHGGGAAIKVSRIDQFTPGIGRGRVSWRPLFILYEAYRHETDLAGQHDNVCCCGQIGRAGLTDTSVFDPRRTWWLSATQGQIFTNPFLPSPNKTRECAALRPEAATSSPTRAPGFSGLAMARHRVHETS
jgi:hypothetical protein